VRRRAREKVRERRVIWRKLTFFLLSSSVFNHRDLWASDVESALLLSVALARVFSAALFGAINFS
jgi:hypothetical protein